MTDKNLRQKFLSFVGQTSSFSPGLEIARAEGNYIWTTDGRKYLDFISGISVTNLGHCHPEIIKAVQSQAAQYAHTMVYGEHIQMPQVLLAEKIVSVAPLGLDCVYFLTTGAEANDAALKLAAKQTGRSRFVACSGAYHGDTVGAMSCFGQDEFRCQFPGLLASVTFIPFGLKEAFGSIDETTAAVLIEPVQGEGGIRLPPPGYLQALRARCNETGTMLIFDEVQTGFGRTGHWFASDTYGVTPDVITMAKGMGAGYPIAGVLAPRQVLYNFAAVPDFSHITTFGGHPVSCAAGLAAMEILEKEQLLQNCIKQGKYLLECLQGIGSGKNGLIHEVRGVGLMIGVETESPETARKLVIACSKRGLILETTLLAESVIRFSPALTISRQECDHALAIFEECVSE